MTQRILFLALAALGGCGPSKKSFDDDVANVLCDRFEECAKAEFEDAYSDQGDCRDTVVDESEDFYDCVVDRCDYDHEKGKDCVSSLKDGDCDELFGEEASGYDDCDLTEIYDCSDADWQECTKSGSKKD